MRFSVRRCLLLSALGLLACGHPGQRRADALPAPSTVHPRPIGAHVAPAALDRGGLAVPGWLGLELATDPLGRGVEVRAVMAGSPAEAAGIQPGDLVTRLDGDDIRQPAELTSLVRERGAGARVGLSLLRLGQPRLVAAELGSRPDDDDLIRREFLGRAAPAFGALEPVQGEPPVSIAAYRGKILVLEFWAPWCAVCRMLAPALTEWNRRMAPAGGMVLGVAAESQGETADGARELGVGYPVLADEAGDTSRRYRAFAVPTLFLVDREGIVRDVLVGYEEQAFAAFVLHVEQLLLAPPPPASPSPAPP